MRRLLLIAALVLSPTVPAAAAAPGTAQNFLDRANRLLGKGPLALVDPDYKRLRGEAVTAGTSIQQEREAAERAGKPILYCSPKPKADLGNREFIDGLKAIPAGQRGRLSLRQAMLHVLQKKYPCRR